MKRNMCAVILILVRNKLLPVKAASVVPNVAESHQRKQKPGAVLGTKEILPNV